MNEVSSAGMTPRTTGDVAAGHRDTTYVMQPGDTLYLVARRFGVRLSELISASRMSRIWSQSMRACRWRYPRLRTNQGAFDA